MIAWHVLEHGTSCLSLGAHNSHSITMSTLGILGRMLELARHDEIELILLNCIPKWTYIFFLSNSIPLGEQRDSLQAQLPL